MDPKSGALRTTNKAEMAAAKFTTPGPAPSSSPSQIGKK
jgi:hypothetical protein